MKLRTHYRWLGKHGADYMTNGYAEINTGELSVRVVYTDKQFPKDEDFRPLPVDLPQLVVEFVDAAGVREKAAVVAAGYRLKEDATYYRPYPEGAEAAAAAYWGSEWKKAAERR